MNTKSFALGYRATNAVINSVTKTANAVVTAAVGTKQVSTGFFAGIRFAINERRNAVALITKDDATMLTHTHAE